jgi:hypothetical protein
MGRAQQARDDPGSPRPPWAAWRSPSPERCHLMLWTILVILLIVLVVLAIMGRGRFGSR